MPKTGPSSLEEVVLILAPTGKDAKMTSFALAEVGQGVEVCPGLQALGQRAARPCGAVLIAEEALDKRHIALFTDLLANQPPWSDLPVILLTTTGQLSAQSQQAIHLLGPHANLTLLERPLRMMTLIRSIESALRARRRQYEVRNLIQQREEVLSSIRDAFILLDRDWLYTYVNAQAAGYTRMTPEELLGKNVWELFPNLITAPLAENMRRAMDEKRSSTLEWHSPALGDKWFQSHVYPSDGGIAMLSVEITERKAIEKTLAESERHLHLVLESLQVGTWHCPAPLDQIFWDPTCCAHFGLEPGTQLDFSVFYSLLHPDDRAPTQEAITVALAAKGNYDVEYRAVHYDGTVRWIHAAGHGFYNEDGEPYRFDGITIDITERKAAEQELEKARKKAIEASQAKDHFLAALSHELRTPLTPVLMAAEELKRDKSLPKHLRDSMTMIYRNVELEARLIDDLLDLTRITQDKLTLRSELADVHQLARQAMEICGGPASESKQLKVTFHPQAQEHHCLCDPARIQQIMWNLLNNAIKFTPEGGAVTLTTTNPAPGQIRVAVEDSGIGIEPHVLGRLFDAFEQGSRSITRRFGGLGLGLAISKRLADLHQGSLHAESDGPGQGARFILELATATVDNLDRTGPVTLPSAARGAPLRILLTEDHTETRQILVRLLSRAGHQVQDAGTTAAARKLAGEHEFDVLVSDLGLPDGTGLDLMKTLRADHPALQGIALSGYGMEADIKASLEAGFSLHLTKPIDWKRLQAAIASLKLRKSDI